MRKERVKLRIIGQKIKAVRKNAIGYLIKYPDADLPEDPKLFKRGMTQEEFAEVLNVSLDTVKNWEQGYNYPRIEDIDKICKKFNVRYDYLFGADDMMQEDLGLSEDALFVLREVKTWGSENVVSHLLENLDFIESLVRLTTIDYKKTAQFSEQSRQLTNSALPEVTHNIIKIALVLFKFVEKERKAHSLTPLRYFIDFIRIADTHVYFD